MKQIQCLRQTCYRRQVKVPSVDRLERIKATYDTFDRKFVRNQPLPKLSTRIFKTKEVHRFLSLLQRGTTKSTLPRGGENSKEENREPGE